MTWIRAISNVGCLGIYNTRALPLSRGSSQWGWTTVAEVHAKFHCDWTVHSKKRLVEPSR